MSLHLMKVHHACVLLDDGQTRLLVDPGRLGPTPPLKGVDALLFTHRHPDHFDPDLACHALQRGLPVWAPADTIADLDAGQPGLHEAISGATFTVGTLDITAGGGHHAELAPDHLGPQNRAYLVAGRLLVTGDAHVLSRYHEVEALVTPIDAPWLRATDLIRYVGTLRPRRVIGIHDGLLNDDGLAVARQVAASLRSDDTPTTGLLRDGEETRIW